MAALLGLAIKYNPLLIAVFIISLALTHTFVDAIPSIFLGAPDADMAIAALPGHKMLLMGKGYEAVKLTVVGSFLCLLVILAFIPFLVEYIPELYAFISPYIGYILIFIALWMILLERGIRKKFLALYIIIQSGVFGLLVLNLPNLRQPLFPMFTGLFGISTLLLSFGKNSKIPEQKKRRHVRVGLLRTFKAVISGTVAGSITGLFPGIGSGQASIIGMLMAGRRIGKRALLIVLGGANTVNFAFSLATFYAIDKARNGAIIAVREVVEKISFNELMLFISVSLIAGSMAVFLALGLGKVFSSFMQKVNYRIMVTAIMVFIFVMVFLISGLIGLIVLLTATFVGIMPALLNVKRSHNMGSLLIPVILYFLV